AVRGRCSWDEQIHEFIDRRLFQPARIRAELKNSLLPLRREVSREMSPEFLDQDRHAFLAAAPVAERVLAEHFLELAAVLALDAEGVGDRALLRVVVVAGEALVLHASDFFSQSIDPGIRRDIVLVVRGREPTEA